MYEDDELLDFARTFLRGNRDIEQLAMMTVANGHADGLSEDAILELWDSERVAAMRRAPGADTNLGMLTIALAKFHIRVALGLEAL
jgi:hypothetical protein